MSYWSVALTKPNSEQCALANLTRQGYNAYLPQFISRIKGKQPKVKALFPRYIFIHVESQFHSINGTYGVSYLLMTESKPVVVPDAIINELKGRENDRGLIVLPPNPKFKIGQSVRIANSPLSGYNLLYDGMSDADRAYVLLEILGRKVSIEVDEDDLVAV